MGNIELWLLVLFDLLFEFTLVMNVDSFFNK